MCLTGCLPLHWYIRCMSLSEVSTARLLRVCDMVEFLQEQCGTHLDSPLRTMSRWNYKKTKKYIRVRFYYSDWEIEVLVCIISPQQGLMAFEEIYLVATLLRLNFGKVAWDLWFSWKPTYVAWTEELKKMNTDIKGHTWQKHCSVVLSCQGHQDWWGMEVSICSNPILVACLRFWCGSTAYFLLLHPSKESPETSSLASSIDYLFLTRLNTP